MTITAAIKFTQGPNTDAFGNAIFGTLTDGPVVCTSQVTGGVTGYVWELVDSPVGSGLTNGVFSTSASGTMGVPGARGGYLVRLTVTNGTDTYIALLVFQIKELSGRWIPPYKAPDVALTFGGGQRGWSPSMEAWLHYVDSLPLASVATPIPIVTVITANVANLAAAPSANDGYTFANGDVLALAYQTNSVNNRLYTYNAGVLTPLAVQPADRNLLGVTRGVNGSGSLWSYGTGSILPANGSAGVIQGTYTITDFAPDAIGLKIVTNPGVPKQAFTNDGTYHTVWAFDFVARGFTTGAISVEAKLFLVDGTKSTSVRAGVDMFCSASPTAGAPAVVSYDIRDDGGGPYIDARWYVVGTSLCLQIKMLQSGTFNCVGIVGGAVGQ